MKLRYSTRPFAAAGHTVATYALRSVSILKSRPYGPNDVGAHLAHLKLDPSNRLSIRNSEVRIQSRVTDDRRERVPVLVRQPLTESDGSASRSDSRSAALTTS